MTTTDLSEFGYRELKMARDLLDAMFEQGLPEDFSGDGVTVMMNKLSGYVFLTNEEYQVAMLNGDNLEMHYHCFECGNEGFLEEIDCECFEK